MSSGSKKRSLDIAFQELPDDDCKPSWKDGLYADWALHLGSKIFRVHRVVLGTGCRRSLFLATAFRKPLPGQANETDLKQLLPECCQEAFECVLDFMYGNEIRLKAVTWAPALKIADVLQIPSLLSYCQTAWHDIMSAASLFEVCASAFACDLKGEVQSLVLERAAEELVSEFASSTRGSDMITSLITRIEQSLDKRAPTTQGWLITLLSDVLSRDDLEARSEDEVFEFIQSLASKMPEASQLWVHCRVHELSPERLLAAVGEAGISRQQLAEAAAFHSGDRQGALGQKRLYQLRTSQEGRAQSLTFIFKMPSNSPQGTLLSSAWKPFTKGYSFKLKIFPGGTNNGRSDHIGAFVEIKPNTPYSDNWELKAVGYRIVHLGSADDAQEVKTDVFTFGSNAPSEDRGWHNFMQAKDAFLDGSGRLCFEASCWLGKWGVDAAS